MSAAVSEAKKPAGSRTYTDALRAIKTEFRPVLKQCAQKLCDEAAKAEDGKTFGTCWLCVRTPSQDTPQMQVTIAKGVVMTLQCSHIVLIGNDKEPLAWYEQASHRCGNRFCINPEHLLWELPWDNLSRDGCHKYRHFSSCPHQPSCLPEPDFNAVKAALQERRQQGRPSDAKLNSFRTEVTRRQLKRKAAGDDPGYHSKSTEYNALYYTMVTSKKAKTTAGE
jgi:hypothetical protein